MFGLLIVILMVLLLFKITFFMFRVMGKIMACILGVIGWLIMGCLSITVFGLTLVMLPIILIVGAVALVAAILL